MKKRRKEPETLREHCRHIFGDEPPVLCVWETEFDYADAELKALAAKEWQQISEWDLSAYYVLNLVYNEPMQIELFRYLFPLCLAQWHETVLAGGYGDHFEESLMKALCRPYLWQEMMNASQRQQVRNFYWTPRCSVWITSVVSITFFAGWRCSILWVGPRR